MKRIAQILLAALLVGGCVTERVDWSARIGHYSYDEAVTDFGPPDKYAKLSDGTAVAEWITQRAHVVVAPEPYFLPPGCYFGPMIPTYTETYVPARAMRLTFDEQGLLQAGKEVYR